MAYKYEGIIALAILSLTACKMVGPNFHPPAQPLPKQFERQKEMKAASTANRLWWKQLKDPIMDKLIEQALTNSPQIAEAKARVLEARAIRGIVKADFYPQLSGQSFYNRNHGSKNVPVGVPPGGLGLDINSNVWMLGFDANWELDIFGGTRRAVESTNASLAAAVETQRDVVITLIAEIARNYVELRNTQRHLAIAKQLLAIRGDTLKLTQSQFNSGLANSLDVTRAQANLSDNKAEIPLIEANMYKAIYRIAVLTGAVPEALTPMLMTRGPVPDANIGIPTTLPSDLLKRRPDIRAAEQRIRAANARIGLAEADLYPHFSLTGLTGLETLNINSLFNINSGYYSVGPAVTWLIFDAGKVRARMLAEYARTDATAAQYRKIILDALQEVEGSLVSYAQSKIATQSLVNEVTANRKAYYLAKRLYEKGLEDFLTVLEAERSLQESENKRTDANRDTAIALIGLYKALGGGWDALPVLRS
ncbi:MAG: efflux transporter outer membrane subunit [Legionellales bacterium]